MLAEEGGSIFEALPYGDIQWRHAIVIGRIDIRAVLDEEINNIISSSCPSLEYMAMYTLYSRRKLLSSSDSQFSIRDVYVELPFHSLLW